MVLGKHSESLCPGNGCKPTGDAAGFPGVDFRDTQLKVEPENLNGARDGAILPLPGSTSIRLLASLFSEGMITNEDAFDDQINGGAG